MKKQHRMKTLEEHNAPFENEGLVNERAAHGAGVLCASCKTEMVFTGLTSFSDRVRAQVRCLDCHATGYKIKSENK